MAAAFRRHACTVAPPPGPDPFLGRLGPAINPPRSYKDDIALMRTLGLRNFRFSLSWTRIFPNGTGAVNQVHTPSCHLTPLALPPLCCLPGTQPDCLREEAWQRCDCQMA